MDNSAGRGRETEAWSKAEEADLERAELARLNNEAAAEQAAEQIVVANEAARRLGQIGVENGAMEVHSEVFTPQGELVQDNLEELRPEEFVGEETPVTELGRLAEDQEDLARELQQGVKREYRLVEKSTKGLVQTVTSQVDQLLGAKEFEVADLVQNYNQWNREALDLYYQRSIGGRN